MKQIKGSSFVNSANVFSVGCDNLAFDYTNAPPNAAHQLSVNTDLSPDPIRISPNPATGTITIEGAPLNNPNVTIMNILGETVMEMRNIISPNFTIDLSKLDRGIYYIRFASAGSVTTRKIVKE